MSSFVRNIQRSIKRASEESTCRAAHYMGRGRRLGEKNPKDPCVNKRFKKPVKPWRAKHHSPEARAKISVAAAVVRSTRADRKGLHVVKMARKKERNEQVHRAIVAYRVRQAAAQ